MASKAKGPGAWPAHLQASHQPRRRDRAAAALKSRSARARSWRGTAAGWDRAQCQERRATGRAMVAESLLPAGPATVTCTARSSSLHTQVTWARAARPEAVAIASKSGKRYRAAEGLDRVRCRLAGAVAGLRVGRTIGGKRVDDGAQARPAAPAGSRAARPSSALAGQARSGRSPRHSWRRKEAARRSCHRQRRRRFRHCRFAAPYRQRSLARRPKKLGVSFHNSPLTRISSAAVPSRLRRRLQISEIRARQLEGLERFCAVAMAQRFERLRLAMARCGDIAEQA